MPQYTLTLTKAGDGGGASMVIDVSPAFNMAQTLSDGAQRTTFSAMAMVTGNLGAQSFFPPGKVADYTGFQYLRDNDPDGMGHNTSFLTRVAYNIIYILNESQFDKLKTVAVSQQSQIDGYGDGRFPLMKAFRRLLENDIPVGTTGLNLSAINLKNAISHELTRIFTNKTGSYDKTIPHLLGIVIIGYKDLI